MQLYELELLLLRPEPPKFGSHRQCGSEDIIFLVFHVVSPDHVIIGSYDHLSSSSL